MRKLFIWIDGITFAILYLLLTYLILLVMDEKIINELLERDIDNIEVGQDFLDDMEKERVDSNNELDSHNDIDPDTMSLTISLS